MLFSRGPNVDARVVWPTMSERVAHASETSVCVSYLVSDDAGYSAHNKTDPNLSSRLDGALVPRRADKSAFQTGKSKIRLVTSN